MKFLEKIKNMPTEDLTLKIMGIVVFSYFLGYAIGQFYGFISK